MEYYSKVQMLDEAARAGYGDGRGLNALFVARQQAGIISRAARRAGRRGEGLWHPVQRALWLMALADRARGVDLATIANAPIGLWLLGWPGVENRQARRALYFFVGAKHAGHNLRPLLAQLLAGVPHLTLVQNEAADSLYAALLTGTEPSNAARDLVLGQYEQFRLIFRAAREIEALCGPHAAAPLWEWVRRRCQHELGDYARRLPELRAGQEIGQLFEELTLMNILDSAGRTVLLLFGMALEVLDGHPLPPGFEPPPDVRTVLRGTDTNSP
jgi:hypothetical protein